ncbi:kelch-like protein 20 [Dendronephthya gigantea]|uniref:kelch-like protein 20 n=1 Tax=Dendronephthya gigantea TaxID=151771 RepID=UPI00106A702D|nr:kelch-like protein 20 [Dendronephthya gigantea]
MAGVNMIFKTESPFMSHTVCSHATRVLSLMNRHRREKEKLCDVVLRVAGRDITTHRAVLAACSPYFYAMFSGELAESRARVVAMQDIHPDILENLVEFAYTGRININVENVQALLATSSLIQFHEVGELCCKFLETQLDPTNCLGIRKFVEAHGCTNFLESVDRFVLQKFKDVVKSEEYNLLPGELLLKVLSSDDLNVNYEEEVYESVLKWVSFNISERSKFLPQILENVRLPLISKDYLLSKIDNEPLIRVNMACRDLLDEAKNYYLVPDRRAQMRNQRMKPRKSTVGWLFAVGGKEAGETIANSVECYHMYSNKWQRAAPLNSSRQQLGVGVINGSLYAVGGSDGYSRLNSVERYDRELDRWIYTKSLNTSRSGVGVGTLGDALYALGGYDGRTCLKTVERYDPQVDCWSCVASLNVTRSFPGVAELGNSLFVIGGNDGTSFLNSCERYDPLTNKWSYVPPMSRPRAGIGAAVVDGILYVAGGFDGISRLSLVEMFEPRMNAWQEVAAMNSCRDGVCMVNYGSQLYAIGGIDGPSYLSTVEIFDPKNNTWEEVLPMETCRAAAGVAVLPDVYKM